MDALLRLYPARYRAAHGAEIVSVFREATASLSGLAVLREWFSLIAHALRLRTRTGSADPVGRVLAAAAPLALGGAVGVGLLPAVTIAAHSGTFLSAPSEYVVPFAAIAVAEALAPVAALLCALTGRWQIARLLVMVAVVEKVVLLCLAGVLSAYLPPSPGLFLAGGALMGLLVLLAPPDLLAVHERGERLAVGAMALLSRAPVVLFNTLYLLQGGGYQPLLPLEPAWAALVPATVVLVALAGGPRPDRTRALGAVLAVLPWIAVLADPTGGAEQGAVTAGTVCTPLLAAGVLAAVIRLLRTRSPARPLDSA